MKKILLLSSIIISAAVNAQTLTQANHAPANSDTYTMTAISSTNTSQGAAGTGVTWNFSSVVLSTTVSAFTGANSSNAAYNPANIVVNANTGESSYYLGSATALKYYGGNIVIAGNPATITYTSPANYAKYPMSFGTTTTAAIGGTLTALSNNGTFTGNATAVADGFGTLMLPGKTYTNVLRVLSTQTINFAVPSAFISNGVLNQDVYNFYIPGRKAPIYTVSNSTVVAPPIISSASTASNATIASDYLTPVGLTENTETITDLVVFPNPTSNFITLKTANISANTVDVFDITGKKISTHSFTNGQASFNTSTLVSGIYIYTIKSNTNQTLSSGKFTVSH